MERKGIPKKIAKIVFERDNYICQSCGVKIHTEPFKRNEKPKKEYRGLKGHAEFYRLQKLNKPHNSHKACVDHIVPFDVCGKDEIDNYQTLCSFCNTTKCNKSYPKGFNIKIYKLVWDLVKRHDWNMDKLNENGFIDSYRKQLYSELLDEFRDYIEEIEDMSFINNWYGLFTEEQKIYFEKQRWYFQHFFPVITSL